MIRSSALVLMAALVAMNAGLCVCNPGSGPERHCGSASPGAKSNEDPDNSGSCHSHSHSKPTPRKTTLPESCCCDGKVETLVSDPVPLTVATDTGSLLIPLALPDFVIAASVLTPDAMGSDSGPPRPSAVPLYLRIHRLSI